MADTLERTSPLQPWAEHFARLPNSVAMVEEPFVTMVDVRVDAAGPGAQAAAELLGVELPTTASTYAKIGDTTVIWLGPDEWLVTGTTLAGPELEARLREAVGPHGGAAVDVSGQRTTLRLRGSYSRDVLAKGTARSICIPPTFGEGAARRRPSDRPASSCWPSTGSGTDYRILVRSPSPAIWPTGYSTQPRSTRYESPAHRPVAAALRAEESHAA